MFRRGEEKPFFRCCVFLLAIDRLVVRTGTVYFHACSNAKASEYARFGFDDENQRELATRGAAGRMFLKCIFGDTGPVLPRFWAPCADL